MKIVEALQAIARVRSIEESEDWHDACDRCARELIVSEPDNRRRTYSVAAYQGLVERDEEEQARVGGV